MMARINTRCLLRNFRRLTAPPPKSAPRVRSPPDTTRTTALSLSLSLSPSSSSFTTTTAVAQRNLSTAIEHEHEHDPPKRQHKQRRPRRRKAKYEQFSEAKLTTTTATATGVGAGIGASLQDPFEYSGDSIEEYREKANLSPWVPVPDSVARKIFDRALPEQQEDGSDNTGKADEIHVELGCGDGRVNFHAIEYGVKESIGIDVDEDVVERGQERLKRIHPQPNLRFVVSDLMDPNSPAWTEFVPKATILTMYFATDGLEKIRPLLEQALRGKRCKVFACGYAMPGWDPQIVETVLDIPIHFYDWGNDEVNMMAMQPSDSFVDNLQARGGMAPSDNMDQYMGRKNKKSTFVQDPLPGYHPDDLIDYGWMDDFKEETSEKEGETKK